VSGTATIAHTGESAKAYFDRLKQERDAASAPEVQYEQARVGVTRPGRLLGPEAIKRLPSRSTVAQIVKRLHAASWDVRVAWSKAYVTSVRYVDDSAEDAAEPHQKGDVRYPGHFLETLVLLAAKKVEGGSMAMSASFTKKGAGSWSFEGAETYDPWLERVWRSSQTKPRPQRDWEKADDVPAPIGLTEWLKIVAPTAAELKKKQREKETVND
jgi:hypothetical protein